MQDDIKKLKSSLSKKDADLEALYNDAEEHKERLIKLEEAMQESVVILNSKK